MKLVSFLVKGRKILFYEQQTNTCIGSNVFQKQNFIRKIILRLLLRIMT